MTELRDIPVSALVKDGYRFHFAARFIRNAQERGDYTMHWRLIEAMVAAGGCARCEWHPDWTHGVVYVNSTNGA